eukprot:TRINITY_DN1523_c0_g1_i1.p1 TRINITY_DN1523_c0_g1~~TRINITY_DN1523_c0_g1_i1.p1  ORF type:complete len:346 (+),score=42.05 TRINITY_DN1523_c0_g1_i1:121-1158(+)
MAAILSSNAKTAVPLRMCQKIDSFPWTVSALRRTTPTLLFSIGRDLKKLSSPTSVAPSAESSRRPGPRCALDDGKSRLPKFDPLLADNGIDCPVPLEQQPMKEYENLLDTAIFPWVTMGPVNYGLRLAGVGLLFSLLIGWPVSSISFDPKDQALQCVLGTLAGGQVAVTLATLRLYLGWAYVGNRLFSATVEYEETGWYDGQVWVKTPELLARDRLLASYRVKPLLDRLKSTLIGLGVSLAATSLLLVFLPSKPPLAEPPYGRMYIPREAAASLPGYVPRSAQLYESDALVDDEDNDGDANSAPAVADSESSISISDMSYTQARAGELMAGFPGCDLAPAVSLGL